MEIPANEPMKKQNSGGCSGAAAIAVLSLVTIFLTLVVQITNYVIVQMIFEGSVKVPNIRWIIVLGYGVLLLVLSLIAGVVVKEPVSRERLNTLRNISFLVILLSPSHIPYVTNWQLTMELQIAAAAVFLAGLYLINRIKGMASVNARGAGGLIALGIGAGAVLGVPWVLWGALGSWFDSLLAVTLSALLGVIVALLMGTENHSGEVEQTEEKKKFGLAGTGWLITLVILIIATAIDQNGNGWLYAVSMLPLGFAASALVHGSRGDDTIRGRWAAGFLMGFGFLWPMMMIDPDELSLIITSSKGELLSYAARSSFIGMLVAIFVLVGLLFWRNISKNNKSGYLAGWGVMAIAWIGLAVLYISQGIPGFNGEKVFVVMKAQTDLSKEAAIPNVMDRRKAVYSSLVSNSLATQKDIRSWLETRNISYKSYYLVNGLELEADPWLRSQLEARPDVDRVLDSPMLRPLPEAIPAASGTSNSSNEIPWGIKAIQADRVHDELGVYGEGVIVGNSDTGVQGDHPEVTAQYRGKLDGSDDYNWLDPWNGSLTPTDIGGHGTHTLGSILGKNVGVAPKAEWIGCVNLARNLGNPGYYLDCMQFMLAPYPEKGDSFTDGKPEKGAHVLNNSWGCPGVEGCDPQTFLPAVSALKTAGVFVVASAGNTGMGGCSTVQDPIAIYGDVYTVGAIDVRRTLADFSSVGPVSVDGSGRIKPDILAPGVNVESSYPGSSYYSASGTSMAGPHVVGVVALMWSANPKLVGDIDKTREILNETADPYEGPAPVCGDASGVPNNASGYGIVNAYKAVEKALEIR